MALFRSVLSANRTTQKGCFTLTSRSNRSLLLIKTLFQVLRVNMAAVGSNPCRQVACQTCTAPSSLLEAIRSPLGDKATRNWPNWSPPVVRLISPAWIAKGHCANASMVVAGSFAPGERSFERAWASALGGVLSSR